MGLIACHCLLFYGDQTEKAKEADIPQEVIPWRCKLRAEIVENPAAFLARALLQRS